jgi:hypothetical protein
MPKIKKRPRGGQNGNTNRRIYPWDEWLRRRHLVLKRGKDFEVEPYIMSQMIRLHVYRNGIVIRVSIQIDGDILRVEFKEVL